MSRTTILTLSCVSLFLLLVALTVGGPSPGWELSDEEPAVYLAALSLAEDLDRIRNRLESGL